MAARVLLLLALAAVASVQTAARSFRASVIFTEDESELNQWGASAAYHARQLVHANTWGTMATTSLQFDGIAYGNIVSYSDGIGKDNAGSTGELFFYLTPLDFTAADLAKHPNATLSISLAQEGEHACKLDTEDPTCWRITLLGSVAPVAADRKAHAEEAIFSRHPEMRYWPKDHLFAPYVMELHHIVLLDFYGGAKHVPIDQYYAIKL